MGYYGAELSQRSYGWKQEIDGAPRPAVEGHPYALHIAPTRPLTFARFAGLRPGPWSQPELRVIPRHSLPLG